MGIPVKGKELGSTITQSHIHMPVMCTLNYFPVGNMIDCKEKRRAISEREAKEAASRLGVDYIEASSLEAINIDKVLK